MKEIKISIKELKNNVDEYFFDGQPERLNPEGISDYDKLFSDWLKLKMDQEILDACDSLNTTNK